MYDANACRERNATSKVLVADSCASVSDSDSKNRMQEDTDSVHIKESESRQVRGQVTVGGQSNNNNIPTRIQSIYPDTLSSTCGSTRESYSDLPRPLSPSRSAEARDARAQHADDEMETTPGLETESSASDRSDCDMSDTEGERRKTRQRAIEKTVRQKVNIEKCTPHVVSLLKDNCRNNTFTNIVIDRRGNGMPKLVCCSEDIVLTSDTGTGEVDCHIKERQDNCHSIGDELSECSKLWPQVDREGIYKEKIKQLSADLRIAMDIIRFEATATQFSQIIEKNFKAALEEIVAIVK